MGVKIYDGFSFPSKEMIRDSLLWDARPGHPFIYTHGDNTVTTSNGPLYKFNTITEELTTANILYTSILGMPDMDRDGFIYDIVQDNGNLTFVRQAVGKIDVDSMKVVAKGHNSNGSTVYLLGGGNFKVDRRGKTDRLYVHATSDQNTGQVWIFRASDMLLLHNLPKTTFTSGFIMRDMDVDKDGNAWCLTSSSSNTAIWKVTPDGKATQEVFLSGMRGLHFRYLSDHSFIIFTGALQLVKIILSPAQVIPIVTPQLSTFNKSSFHHTHDLPMLFLGGNKANIPFFLSIDTTTLEQQSYEYPESKSFYPVFSGLTSGKTAAFFQPGGVIQSPLDGTLWSEEVNGGTFGSFLSQSFSISLPESGSSSSEATFAGDAGRIRAMKRWPIHGRTIGTHRKRGGPWRYQ